MKLHLLNFTRILVGLIVAQCNFLAVSFSKDSNFIAWENFMD